MGLEKLVGDARRLGLGSSVAILQGNLRQYGWRGTLRKLARRFVSVDSVAKHHQSVLQRQGIADVQGAASLFGCPSVLVVGALDLPQCKKYRVLQKLEYCERAGWACHYASYQDEARALGYLQFATSLILYRVPDGPQLDAIVAEARRLGVQVLYDIDDPIFDDAVYSENRNLEHLQLQEKQAILASVPLYREAMLKADGLILSTSYLAALAEKTFDLPVYVWRNLVDATTLSTVEGLIFSSLPERGGKLVIAYTSGSRAHEEDFREAAPALLSVLKEHDDVILRVIGYAQLPDEFAAFAERIEQRPFSSYQQYLQALGDSDLCVIPLVTDRFNACKSAIRFLEAGLCKVPVIASCVGQFEEMIDSGHDGLLVQSDQDWQDAIQSLLQEPQLRENLAVAAQRKIMSTHQVDSDGAVDELLIERIKL